MVAMIVASPTATAVTLPLASTVATASFDDFHVTDLSVVVAGATVALSVNVSVALRVADVLSNEIEVASVLATVILQVADLLEPSAVVAVIVASPTATAVTLPLASTVATASFDDFHVTDLSVVVAGATVALSVNVSVALSVADVLSNEIEVASVLATVILQVADLLEPSAVVAVIVVSPTATAVTLPLASTVATASFDDFQVTDLSVVVAGAIVALRVNVSVALSVADVLSNEIEVASVLATVILQVADLLEPSAVVAAIVASPTATAVTLPLASTVATASLDDVHVTDLLVAFSGNTVATRVRVSVALRLAVVLFKVTDSASVLATVILQVADLLEPSVVVAVIVASPTAIAVTLPLASTVAIASFDDVHVTDLFVAVSGSTVAVSVVVPLTLSDASVTLRVIDSALVATTVTLQEAERLEPSEVVAVIVASPTATAVTLPLASTVATASFDDFQVTDLLVVVAGATVALRVNVSVALSVADVLSNEIEDASVFATVILQVADLLEPSAVVAVIIASPTATAVTLPLVSTVAIASFEDFHVTVLFVAVSGSTVAVSVVVPSTLSDASVTLSVIDSANVATMVILQEAERLEPSVVVAVIVASPTATAVTLPLASTVATASFDDFQVTDLSVVVAGAIVALRVNVSVALSVADVLSNEIEVASVLATVILQVADLLEPSAVVAAIVASPTATAVTLPLASTVATASLDDVHVTDLLVAFSGNTVATRVRVSVALRLAVVLFKVTDSASVLATVILQVADLLEPSVVVAVIVASPSAIAVTLPLASTVATDVLDDVHVTDLSVVVAGATVALSVNVSVALSVADVLSNEIEVASVLATVILQVADLLEPSAVVAVIVASPTETAVTLPLTSTVATASFDDFQVTDLSVVVAGATVALRVNVSVALRVADVLSNEIEDASVFATVILQVADLLEPSAVVAVIVVSPTATAVTLPLASTIATASFDDFHVTDLLVVNSGSTVATSVAVSVASRLISVLSSVIVSASVGTTVTLQDAERSDPSVVVAVIVASPIAMAVTTPFSSTIATLSFELFQVTDLLAVVSGSIVATNIIVSVALSETVVMSRVIDSARVGTTLQETMAVVESSAYSLALASVKMIFFRQIS